MLTPSLIIALTFALLAGAGCFALGLTAGAVLTHRLVKGKEPLPPLRRPRPAVEATKPDADVPPGLKMPRTRA